MQVAIKDQDTGETTVGRVAYAKVGEVVTVQLQGENGMPINATGEVLEVLSDE